MLPASFRPSESLLGQSIGRYRLVREVARGGMGVVFEAVHESIGHRAAVKLLSGELAEDPKHDDYLARFLDEARAVNVIGHPGVVNIFDFGALPDGTVYIMMEMLDGESLVDRQDRLGRNGSRRLSLPAALRITGQVASALAAAHDKGILHRDLKPDNVILVPAFANADRGPGEEQAKVVDFGIARFLDSPERRTTLGKVMGTPYYMAPEQCLGEETGDRTDVYALGAMLYEMLSGSPPFDGEAQEVMMLHMTGTPHPLAQHVPSLPEEVPGLVHQMLAKDPAARPSMTEVLARVGQLAGKEGPVAQRPAGVPVLPGPEKWLARGLVAGLVGEILVAALLLRWWLAMAGR